MNYPIYKPSSRFILTTIDRTLALLFKPSRHTIPPPRSLLLANRGHLGDVVLTTALIAPLKEMFPTLKIGVLTRPETTHVLQGHPQLDTLHTPGDPLPYDVALDCRFHFPNFAPLLWRARIPTRIGFTSAGCSPLLTHPFPWTDRSAPAVESFLTLLAPFNRPFTKPSKPSLPPLETPLKRENIIFHTEARDPSKEWPHENWVALAARLLDEGERIILTGQKRTDIPCTENRTGSQTWEQFVQTIASAKRLVSVDTVAAHVAAAYDTPVVVVSNAVHPSNLWKPFGKQVIQVRSSPSCSPCLTGCPAMNCLKTLSVEIVYEATRHFDS